jgi:hypothetical protein
MGTFFIIDLPGSKTDAAIIGNAAFLIPIWRLPLLVF